MRGQPWLPEPPMQALPVVAINGWGMPAELFAPCLTALDAPLILIDLDDSWIQPGMTAAEAVERLLTWLPDKALLVGWSLGGQLAMALAARAPQQVQGVVTLASTPCFIARPDWPSGMAAPQFAVFRQGMLNEPLRQWRDFLRLQVHGDEYQREALRMLRTYLCHGPKASGHALMASLDWLGTLDLRLLWPRPPVPVIHVQGAHDPLLSAALTDWLGAQSAALTVVPGMAHLPWGAHASSCRQIIQQALTHFQQGTYHAHY
ncbi:MAG: alpha/beta fold hydrolase [Marinobacter sp.]|nr:alpha/beta fold hydrolase [Marinobacter sp.]